MGLNNNCVKDVLTHLDENLNMKEQRLTNGSKHITFHDLFSDLHHHTKDDIFDAICHLSKNEYIVSRAGYDIFEITEITQKGYQYLNALREEI